MEVGSSLKPFRFWIPVQALPPGQRKVSPQFDARPDRCCCPWSLCGLEAAGFFRVAVSPPVRQLTREGVTISPIKQIGRSIRIGKHLFGDFNGKRISRHEYLRMIIKTILKGIIGKIIGSQIQLDQSRTLEHKVGYP